MATNSKAIGETTEAVILAHLVRRGDSVSLPFGNTQRYDMIVDRRDKLIKAQFAYRADEEWSGGTRAIRSRIPGTRRRSRTCVIAL